MSNFFDKFPKTPYTIDRGKYKVNNYDTPVNILVRIGIIKNSLDSVFNYSEYTIRDGDTPEIIAEKMYGDPEAHWVILLANNIIDPQFDWPMNYDVFGKYIIAKYGSIATAQTQVHHYEKIIKSVDVSTGVETYNKFEIGLTEYNSLPASIGNYYSKTINGYVVDVYDAYRNVVYAYDWEVEQNENRRQIKLIKPIYYDGMKREFDSIMRNASPTTKMLGIRSLT